MFIYAFLILLAVAALAQSNAQLEIELSALDQDQYGHVTIAEVENYFLSYDDDKDGEISQAEFKAGVDRLNSAFNETEQALYEFLDRKLDNKVNKADFDAVFALADSNKDGKITKPEFKTLFNLVFIIVG